MVIDPEDLAAFQSAVADIQPLPPSNRAEIIRPKRQVPPRPKAPAIQPTPRSDRNAGLPAHWRTHREGTLPPRPTDPEQAAFEYAMVGVQPLPDRNLVVHQTHPPPPKALQHIADEHAALHESLHGLIALQDRLEGGDEPAYLRTASPRTCCAICAEGAGSRKAKSICMA